MSAALSMLANIHHRIRFAVSPSYRQVRRRLEEISQPVS
jgi:hypothetical protein